MLDYILLFSQQTLLKMSAIKFRSNVWERTWRGALSNDIHKLIIFPDPSCEDTLFHSSYPNDTGAFISWLLGLLKHLVEIRKRPIFFVGTLLWGHFTLRTLPTCGDCGLDSTYGHTELHTRLVGIASWDSTYGYTWQNTLLVGTSWTVRIGTRQYTQLVLVGQSFAQLERPIW